MKTITLTELELATLTQLYACETLFFFSYAMESIQHQNAVKFKAATFVGRRTLVEKAFQHCTTNNLPNTLILHGEPGCGKSGLLAKVAVDCLSRVEETKDFLFIHAVDTCPGSSILEGEVFFVLIADVFSVAGRQGKVWHPPYF